MWLLGVQAPLSWGELIDLMPSLSVWGFITVTIVGTFRWLVDRSDGITDRSIVRLTEQVDRAERRNRELEDRWDRHVQVCPLMRNHSDG